MIAKCYGKRIVCSKTFEFNFCTGSVPSASFSSVFFVVKKSEVGSWGGKKYGRCKMDDGMNTQLCALCAFFLCVLLCLQKFKFVNIIEER